MTTPFEFYRACRIDLTERKDNLLREAFRIDAALDVVRQIESDLGPPAPAESGTYTFQGTGAGDWGGAGDCPPDPPGVIKTHHRKEPLAITPFGHVKGKPAYIDGNAAGDRFVIWTRHPDEWSEPTDWIYLNAAGDWTEGPYWVAPTKQAAVDFINKHADKEQKQPEPGMVAFIRGKPAFVSNGPSVIRKAAVKATCNQWYVWTPWPGASERDDHKYLDGNGEWQPACDKWFPYMVAAINFAQKHGDKPPPRPAPTEPITMAR